MLGGAFHARHDYFSLHGLQAAQLYDDQEQEKQSGSFGNEKVLQVLQQSPRSPRDPVTGWIDSRWQVRDGGAPFLMNGSGLVRGKLGMAVSYFREVIGEMKKVHWPNRKELTSYTITVVLVCLVMFLLTFGFDVLVTKGFQALGIGN